MITIENEETRYFIEIDLDSLEIIRVGFDQREILNKGQQKQSGTHRIFLSKGQFNKFVSRCEPHLQHVLDAWHAEVECQNIAQPFPDTPVQYYLLGRKWQMPGIRAQYHFRETDLGIDAWDVRRLITLSANFPTRRVDPNSFPELHTNHWYKETHRLPSPKSILEHFRLIQEADLSYPIILDARGNLMDGMHRLCKALLNDIREIDAVQFENDPEPDFSNCNPQDLPYSD